MDRWEFADIREILRNETVTIAIAISGGGYRSMLTGAGVLSAFDENTPGASAHLGGLLQSTSYIAGNSGGSWLVVHNLLNEDTSLSESVRNHNFASSLVEGMPDLPVAQLRANLDAGAKVNSSQSPTTTEPKGSLAAAILKAFFKISPKSDSEPSSVSRTLSFYKDLNIEVRPKRTAGHQVSLVDYWGRAVARRIFPAGKSSVSLSLSSVMETKLFCNFSQPFPIFGTVERKPGSVEPSTESHVFEFNPYEFGSWDPYLDSFVDLRYLGTKLWNGQSQQPTAIFNKSICVAGYDKLGLITGTSSSLFNTFFAYVYKMLLQMEEQSSSVVTSFLKIFGLSSYNGEALRHPEYALITPNPFRGFGKFEKEDGLRYVADEENLFLADGGDDGQNIPFHPLLVPGREIEVILAYDASSDSFNFPNGSSLRRTAARYHSSARVPVFEKDGVLRQIFPHVPTSQEYKDEEMRTQPLFLGCDMADYPEQRSGTVGAKSEQYLDNRDPKIQNLLDQNSIADHKSSEFTQKTSLWNDYTPPLIVYFANHNISYSSNTSTFRTVYTRNDVVSMMENGYNVATSGNSSEFPTCLGCALLKRRVDSGVKYELPSICAYCYKKYCYSANHPQSHSS